MKKAIMVVLVSVIGLTAMVAYSYLKPPAQASGPIQAVPVAPETAVPAQTTPAEPSPAVVGDAPAVSAEPTVFEIDQKASQARFVISEVLRGSPKTVVGTTNQVAGQIVLQSAEPTARVGTILVNARTLVTDDAQRNRAIQNRILLTDQYEYLSFTPTALSGLPNTTSVGETYVFQIAGELKIRDASRPVTFEAAVTPASASRLEGKAATTIRYADWGVVIPQVPFVAGVSEDVRLEIDLVATNATGADRRALLAGGSGD